MATGMCLSACATYTLPAFCSQHWHVDSQSGHAVSSSGLEVAFGSGWMITDTTLLQSTPQITNFPKLSEHLARGMALFPEIAVDSILFYNPHRRLLFATYHQTAPLKPTSETYLYDEDSDVYSKEHARLFGRHYTSIDDTGWEEGPSHTVYTNVRYRPKEKRLVLLQRIPYAGSNIAVFQICETVPKRGRWWADYPPGTFWNTDLGKPESIERISQLLHSSRNLAVENLKLTLTKQK